MEQHVLGLEIAMHDALAMRIVERRGDSGRDSYRFVDRELLLTLQSRAETLALDEGHDVEQQISGRARIE